MLSWCLLSSGLEDGFNLYFFPLAIHMAKEERLALVSFHLESLFDRMDECIDNIVKFVGSYHIVTQVDTAFS